MTTPSSAVTVSDERLNSAIEGLQISLDAFDSECDYQASIEGENTELWDEIDVNADAVRTVLAALAALRAPATEWQGMEPPAPSKVVEEVRRMLAADGKAKFSARNDTAYDEARARLLTALGEAP